MTEHELQSAILDYFQWKNIPVLRVNAGKFQNAMTGSWIQGAETGHPDIICGYRYDNDMWLLARVIQERSATYMHRSFMCRFCPFDPVCETALTGGDVSDILQAKYVVRRSHATEQI